MNYFFTFWLSGFCQCYFTESAFTHITSYILIFKFHAFLALACSVSTQKGWFSHPQNSFLNADSSFCLFNITSCSGRLDVWVSWVSDSWFRFRSWSQGCKIEPRVRLHAQPGVCWRFSLSLSLCPLPHSFSLSLSKKMNKSSKKLCNFFLWMWVYPSLSQCPFYVPTHHQSSTLFLWVFPKPDLFHESSSYTSSFFRVPLSGQVFCSPFKINTSCC